jgi:hypothetical protein
MAIYKKVTVREAVAQNPQAASIANNINKLQGDMSEIQQDMSEKEKAIQGQVAQKTMNIRKTGMNKMENIKKRIAASQNLLQRKMPQAQGPQPQQMNEADGYPTAGRPKEIDDIERQVFAGKVGMLIKYLLKGDTIIVSHNLKQLARDMVREDFTIKDTVNKIGFQLTASEPNIQLLNILRYKIEMKLKDYEEKKQKEEKGIR